MGILRNLFKSTSNEIRTFISDGAVIIDVRTPNEYIAGHIKGSKNIPLSMLNNRVEEIRQLNKPVITVCQSGMRSNTARSFLEGKGIRAINGGSWTSLNNIL
jgi:phage shock protein E